jgi:2-polyprenyl-6-methoxyphenol hydroxylase-like FAD-dependent oxidoreductase
MSAITANRQHAVVLGGSLAGLLAAKALSNHFQQVTIIEKDPVQDQAESRPGQPQTRHLHGLLTTGLNIITDYFPDLPQALVEQGAVICDPMLNTRWYTYGGYRQQFATGLSAVTMTRPLLEHLIRQRVLALPQVELIDHTTVKELLTTPDHSQIKGVLIAQQGGKAAARPLAADLVIDAMGRNSQTPKWLQELGYDSAQESRVEVNVSYATRTYRRDPKAPLGQTWLINTPEAPKEDRFGVMFPVEGDRWIVSVGDWHGHGAPTDESGFLAFVRDLPSPEIYEILRQAEPLSAIIPFKYGFNQRRYYEKLHRFPEGYLVLGDAVCSFNPTYGQGMTVAALESVELERLLAANIAPERLAHRFFQRIAKVVDVPWQMAIGEDFRHPQTTGAKPMGVDLLNRYVAWVHRATLRDVVVGEAFFKVMNLITPPISLFHPRILWRVLSRGLLPQNL